MNTVDKLSRLASSRLPDAALIADHDGITRADVREVMRLLADRDGWMRARDAALAEAAALRELGAFLVGLYERSVVDGAEFAEGYAKLLYDWLEHAREVLSTDAGRAMLEEVRALREQVAQLTRERDEARAGYRYMVEHAADNKLDGYRELGNRAAEAERQRDAAMAREKALVEALGEIDGEWDASPAVKAIVRKALDAAHDAATKEGT